jgi:hypothetical protein
MLLPTSNCKPLYILHVALKLENLNVKKNDFFGTNEKEIHCEEG